MSQRDGDDAVGTAVGGAGPPAGIAAEQLDGLITVLDLVRSGAAKTRPQLARISGLGRNVITQRLGQLIDFGLVEEGSLGRSTGGRAPRELRFRAEAGRILVADLGATSIAVALADLAGNLSGQREEPADIAGGPAVLLGRVDALFGELLAEAGGGRPVEVWGVGVGLPGPVEFATGRPVAPPIMPGWDGFDVRGYFGSRYGAPVWVDNDVNVMVLGELRAGMARGERDVVYVKIGTGIGAGLVSGGRLHRGAQGCAGDIGHIPISRPTQVVCRCGKTDCLEALAGGAALARDAVAAARDGRSPQLAAWLEATGSLEAADVSRAAAHGDPVSVELLMSSAGLVGDAIGQIVAFFNPSLVLIGGGVARSGDLYLATVRQAVFKTALPLATRSLQVARSPLGHQAGLCGAAFMVVDELLSRERLGHWIGIGTPAGQPQLSA